MEMADLVAMIDGCNQSTCNRSADRDSHARECDQASAEGRHGWRMKRGYGRASIDRHGDLFVPIIVLIEANAGTSQFPEFLGNLSSKNEV
jgi:hypothetical protein